MGHGEMGMTRKGGGTETRRDGDQTTEVTPDNFEIRNPQSEITKVASA